MMPVPRSIKSAFIGGLRFSLEIDYPEGICARLVVMREGNERPLAVVYAIRDENLSQAYLTGSAAFTKILRKALEEQRRENVRLTLAIAEAALDDTRLPPPPKTPRIWRPIDVN